MNPENTDETYVHVDDLKLKPTGKFGIPSVRHITRNLTSVKKKLNFEKVRSVSILKISKEFKTNKATGAKILKLRFIIFPSNSHLSQKNVKSQRLSLFIKKVSKLTQRTSVPSRCFHLSLRL